MKVFVTNYLEDLTDEVTTCKTIGVYKSCEEAHNVMVEDLKKCLTDRDVDVKVIETFEFEPWQDVSISERYCSFYDNGNYFEWTIQEFEI